MVKSTPSRQPLASSVHTKKTDKKVLLFGVGVSSTSKTRLLEMFASRLASNAGDTPLTVVTPNPEQLVLATQADAFRDSLNNAGVAVPDGAGVVWALNRMGFSGNLPDGSWQRIPGIELAEALVGLAASTASPVLFLGGKGAVADSAAKACSVKFQGLRVIGMTGFSNRAKPAPQETTKIFETIKRNKIEVMLIGLGAPWQEYWLIDNQSTLGKLGVKVAMVVGGSFDIWAGKLKRAPLAWRRANVEWLWRLYQEPSRLGRQLKLLQFVWMVLTTPRSH